MHATRNLALALVFVPRLAFGYGESDSAGRPSLKERLTIVLTNQARQDPHAWPGWDTSLATPIPRPPVGEEPSLLEAARFHSDDMAKTGHFAHESSDGTPFPTRLARFFDGSGGENILVGDDDPRRALTAWMGSDGHRANILDSSYTHLGAGRTVGALGTYYVQDFGVVARNRIPAIPSASAEILGASMKLVANYFDSAASGPRSMRAAIAGSCLDLSAIAGPPGNQTFMVEGPKPSGCEPLVFFAESSSADLTRYPSSGAILVGTNCAKDFDATLSATPCDADRPVIDAEKSGCNETGSVSPWLAFASAALLMARVDRFRRPR
ncbi:MAG: CAP domain-containing protein [Deltaproteobacteria bacterium]|nr:CAP domain-containing protein [Deltaproteobacteria bacterium]